ncbi:hypothetical protein SDJN03_29048, partial [Cucurbita argyrosperma subsp. sororia]
MSLPLRFGFRILSSHLPLELREQDDELLCQKAVGLVIEAGWIFASARNTGKKEFDQLKRKMAKSKREFGLLERKR